ncbi:transglutaminase-like cysteine peptidase [Vibrio sp. RC27]
MLIRRLAILLCFLFIVASPQALNTRDQMWIDQVSTFYGKRAGKRVESWRNAMEKYKTYPTLKKLQMVNQFFNRMKFVNDIDLWGKNDYWATPLEFLGANAGDCEDFTIAKYFSLIEVGIPDEKLRLVYVKALDYNLFHMVLAYYETPTSVPLILDNLIPKIKPSTVRRDLLPIYSFNGTSLWLMKSKNGQLAGESSRLSLWNDLREKQRSLVFNKPIVKY